MYILLIIPNPLSPVAKEIPVTSSATEFKDSKRTSVTGKPERVHSTV